MTECTDHGWYATHRAKVEADHAAAKEPDPFVEWADHCAGIDEAEGLRPLTDDDISETLAPLRAAYPPPRLDDGIDMDKLNGGS
jgi:hypothetical protein